MVFTYCNDFFVTFFSLQLPKEINSISEMMNGEKVNNVGKCGNLLVDLCDIINKTFIFAKINNSIYIIKFFAFSHVFITLFSYFLNIDGLLFVILYDNCYFCELIFTFYHISFCDDAG